MKALLQNNKVIQVEQNEFPVHSSLVWMDAPEGVEVGWILNNGQLEAPSIPVKTMEDVLKEYENALIGELNRVASLKNYDNQYSVISYINSTNSVWLTEATAYSAWRDACWEYSSQVKSNVEGGQAAPTIEEFINGLPTISW